MIKEPAWNLVPVLSGQRSAVKCVHQTLAKQVATRRVLANEACWAPRLSRPARPSAQSLVETRLRQGLKVGRVCAGVLRRPAVSMLPS